MSALGYQISLLNPDKLTRFLVSIILLATFLFWLLDINFPVGKGRMFLDEQDSALSGKMINGFGSEVNYTAFFFICVISIYALKNQKIYLTFLIPVIGLLQNNSVAFVVFIVIFLSMLLKRAWIPPLILGGMYIIIFMILHLDPDIGMPLFGPRYILWNTAIEVIQEFPNLGYGYQNSRDVMENALIDFDKQYYVHNGFLEAGMAAGPVYMLLGCGIIVGRFYFLLWMEIIVKPRY